MINFPTSIDELTNPITSNPFNSPSHAGQHSDANDAIEALEAKVGANSSAVTTSHDYKITKLETDTKKYAGFENRTDSTLGMSGNNFQITTSSSYNVWLIGTGKKTISSTLEVAITDDQTITYVYFDINGTEVRINKSTSPWDIKTGTAIPVAIVFKDGANYTVTDERHGHSRNLEWHNWAHNNIGTMYFNGLAGTFTNTTLSIAQGIIYDEDIRFDTGGTKTTNTLWYRNASSGMRMIRNATTPYSDTNGNGTGTLQYDNGSGTLQSVSNNRYSTQWVYASSDTSENIYTVIGQNNDTSLNNARNTPSPTINLSTAEWKLLYRVIYRNAGGTATYIEAADFRKVQTGVPTTQFTPTSHSNLTDTDVANSHPATAISFTPSGNIIATDVQSAIEELDTEKQAAGSYEVTTNKETSALDTSTTKYPCNNVVKTAVDAKQATLVSGTNIKTINSTTLLGSGDMVVSGGLAWVAKTTTYTAVSNDGILADTSGGAWTLTLPASPSVGDKVGISDATGSFATNNLTIGRNSSEIMGEEEDLVINVKDASFMLIYTGATTGWKIDTYIPSADAFEKATGTELDTGTDDAKFATAKALKDSHNVPSVAPGTSGNVLTSDGTDWTSAAPSGGGFNSRVRVHPSGNYGTTATSLTQFTVLDTEDYDGNSEFASNTFTCKTAGYYLVVWQLSMASGGISAVIQKNTTTIAITSKSISPIATTIINLAVDDTLKAYYVNGDGQNFDKTSTWFNVHRLS